MLLPAKSEMVWFLKTNKRKFEFFNVNESDPRNNVHYLGSSENKAWKNSGLYGIWTHDLCDTGAVVQKLSSANYCEDHFHSRLYPQFKYMTFIYS